LLTGNCQKGIRVGKGVWFEFGTLLKLVTQIPGSCSKDGFRIWFAG